MPKRALRGMNEMERQIDVLRKRNHELKEALQARESRRSTRPLSKHDQELAARNKYLEQVSSRNSPA